MSLESKLTTIKSALAGLLEVANNKTGASDESIGDAIKTLIDGYGQGGDTPITHTQVITEDDRFTLDNRGNVLHFITDYIVPSCSGICVAMFQVSNNTATGNCAVGGSIAYNNGYVNGNNLTIRSASCLVQNAGGVNRDFFTSKDSIIDIYVLRIK